MSKENNSFKRRTFLKTAGTTGAAFALGGVVSATPGRKPGPKEDEYLIGVSVDGEKARKKMEKLVRKAEKKLPVTTEVVHDNEKLRYVAVRISEDVSEKNREKFLKKVRKNKQVKYIEQNSTFESMLAPNDPRWGDQYAAAMVNADTAWDTTLGSSSVTVAVVDTGAQYTHPDLDDNYKSNPGYDFVDSDSDPAPDVPQDEYHATHVSGIAAGETNNSTGTAGISESSLINGRALSEAGSGSTADIADAIQWATDQGADVINLSLGGGGYTSTMKNAVSYAYNNGVLVVAAAGNASSSSVEYPAAYSECLAVSALDPDGSLASYSNYGSDVELAAPGTNVLSTTTATRGSYEQLSGTSMATPVVAGVAGLALAQWTSLTNAELRNHLKNTAVDVGLSSNQQGSGRVDAANAVGTDPSGGSGGGGGGSGDSTSGSVSDSLSGYWDSDCWNWSWTYSAPSQVVIELSGPSSADFDLYSNEGSSSCPTTSSYDHRSWTADSQETIIVDNPDTSTDLHVLVDSYNGGGSYSLTITEYQ